MFSSISSILKSRVPLLHMGCKDCGSDETYLGVKVLNKLGLEVAVGEFQCGCELYGADDSKLDALIAKNKDFLKNYEYIIVGCARCYHILKSLYGVKVSHISQVILERLLSIDQGVFKGSGEIFYHDPCYLARFETVLDEPRNVLHILGYEVKEFGNNCEKTDCCGDYSPVRALRERGAELRLSQLPSKAVVTAACPKCTQNFSGFNKTNSKITVKHFLEVVEEALDIKIPDIY